MDAERCPACGGKRARTVRNWKHQMDEEARKNPSAFRVKSFWDLDEQQRAVVAVTFVKAMEDGYTVQMVEDELFYNLRIPVWSAMAGMFHTFSSTYANSGLRGIDPNWYRRHVPDGYNPFTGNPWGS